MLWWIAYGLLWLPIKIFFRLEVKGKNNLSSSQPVIIASNHKSYIDPIVLGLAIKQPISFMAKEELFKYPIFNLVIKALYAFPVKRGEIDREAIRKGLEKLEKGFNLGIFPEGTRISGKELAPFKKGIYLFIKSKKYPVLPVAIKGTDRLIKWYAFFPCFNKIEVRIGKPLKFGGADKSEIVKKLEEVVARLYYD